jgi:hypothetical protein
VRARTILAFGKPDLKLRKNLYIKGKLIPKEIDRQSWK